MSEENSFSLDVTFASEYTILPMTRDCHKRFLTIDKLREEAQAAVNASATAAHLPPQMAPDVFYQPSFVNQPIPNFYLGAQPVEQGSSQYPESCLWQPTVAAPETYLSMGDYLPPPDFAYPYGLSAAEEQLPSFSHAQTSLPNTPLGTPRSPSVTPPHANANPANPAAAPLFPDFSLQQQIALPQLPIMSHAAPQSRKAKPKKRTQAQAQVNSQRAGLMDIVLNTRDLQPPPPSSATMRISRPQSSRARPAPAYAPTPPVAGPSRIPAQAGVPQPQAPAFAMPFPYGPAFAYSQSPAPHAQPPPASAINARARPGNGVGPTRPSKTKERSAPYSKREPAIHQNQQHQQHQQRPAASAPPPSSSPLSAPLPPPPPTTTTTATAAVADELPTSHLASSQTDFYDIHGIQNYDFGPSIDDYFELWINSDQFADAPPPPTNATS